MNNTLIEIFTAAGLLDSRQILDTIFEIESGCLTLEQVAEITGEPYQTWRSRAKAGKVPCVRFGRSFVFLRKDINDLKRYE